MPIYEFQCRDCKAAFEKLVGSAAAAEHVTCAQCGSHNVHKILSAPSQSVSKSTPPGLGNAGACGQNSRFR